MLILDISEYNGGIDWSRLEADCILIRSSVGGEVDTRYLENWNGSRHIGRRGAYHYVVTGNSVQSQLTAILLSTGSDFGTEPFTLDCERTNAERKAMSGGWVFPAQSYTSRLHELVQALQVYTPVRLYTSKVEWQAITTEPAWALSLPLWVAHYTSTLREPDCPAGWPWSLWQYGQGMVPGCSGPVDLNREAYPMSATPFISHGSKIGIHSIDNQTVVSLAQKAHDNGFRYPLVKKVNDGSPLVAVKGIDSQTLTLCRYLNPNPNYEALQGVENWTPEDRQTFAQFSIQNIFNNVNDAQLGAVDYFGVINEPDPRTHYDLAGLALIELVREATRRGVKLALPALPQGVPEWDDMNRLVNTGLVGLMKRGGHILDFHEGVFANQPIQYGYGDLIPGAPFVAGAGSTCFRHRYLYHLLEQRDEVVPCIISEFYAGGGYGLDAASTLTRFRWYDELARLESYLLAFCGFTIDPDPHWQIADYTHFYQSSELLAYQIAQKDIPNGDATMDLTQILANAHIARDASQAIIDEVQALNNQPLYSATVLQAVNVRDSNGNLAGFALTVGTQVNVYAEHITAGAFTDRAKINLNGNNIVMTSGGLPTLQHL